MKNPHNVLKSIVNETNYIRTENSISNSYSNDKSTAFYNRQLELKTLYPKDIQIKSPHRSITGN
jgi:hypothetical protein